MRKIKKGDNVIVIAGRDKGKRGSVTQIVDAEHVDQLVNVRLYAACGEFIGIDHHRHARHAGLFGVPDGERLDVVAAPAKE